MEQATDSYIKNIGLSMTRGIPASAGYVFNLIQKQTRSLN